MPAPSYETPFRTAMYLAAEWGDLIPEALPAVIRPDRRPLPLTLPFYRRILAEVGRFIGKGPLDVLDVGSATGRMVFELARSGWPIGSLTGCEPSKGFCELARAILGGRTAGMTLPAFGASTFRTEAITLPELPVGEAMKAFAGPVAIYAEDLDGFAGRDTRYDVVLCLNVIDRCRSPRGLCDAIDRVINPGGILCVASPFDWEGSAAPEGEREDSVLAYFDAGRWEPLADFDIDYALHMSPRKITNFLSHAAVIRRRS